MKPPKELEKLVDKVLSYKADKKLKKKVGYRIVEGGSATCPYTVYEGNTCLGSFPSKRAARSFLRKERARE